MCAPPLISAIASLGAETIAAINLGIAVASAGFSVVQQQQNASAMQKFQQQQYKATRESATASAINQYNALLTRQQQEEAAAAQAIGQSSMRAEAAAATARTTAGETGTAGASVAQLLNEYRQQELGFAQNTIRNMNWMNAQLKMNMEGIRANQQAQINAAAPKPVAAPDYLGAALRIGESALTSASWAYQQNPTKYGYKAPTE